MQASPSQMASGDEEHQHQHQQRLWEQQQQQHAQASANAHAHAQAQAQAQAHQQAVQSPHYGQQQQQQQYASTPQSMQRMPSYEHQRQGLMQSHEYYPYAYSSQPPMHLQPQPSPRQRPTPMDSPGTGTGAGAAISSPVLNPSPVQQQQHQLRAAYYPPPYSAPPQMSSYAWQQQAYYQQQPPPPQYGHPHGHGHPQMYAHAESSAQAQSLMASPQLHHRGSGPAPAHQQQMYQPGPGPHTPGQDYPSVPTPTSATTPSYAPSPWTSTEPRSVSQPWQPPPKVLTSPPSWYAPPPPSMHIYPGPGPGPGPGGGWQSAPSWAVQPPSSSFSAPHPYTGHPMHLGPPQAPHAQAYGVPIKRAVSDDFESSQGKKKKGSIAEESPVARAPSHSTLHPPRQAASAWQLFFTDTLNAAKEAHKTASSSDGEPKLNVAHIAREAGVAYANMSPEQKAQYAEKVQESKEQYAKDLAAWQATLTPDDIRAENAFRAQQRKEGKSRKGNLKDPNAPKKPLSAYFLYLKSIREDKGLRAEIWGDEQGTTKQSVLAAKRWRILMPEEKRPYLVQADLDKVRYEALRRVYEEDTAARARGEEPPVRSPVPPAPPFVPIHPERKRDEDDDEGAAPITPSHSTQPFSSNLATESEVELSPSDFPTPSVLQPDPNPTLSFAASIPTETLAPENSFTSASLSYPTLPGWQSSPFSDFPVMQSSMDFGAVMQNGQSMAYAAQTVITTSAYIPSPPAPLHATIEEIHEHEAHGVDEEVSDGVDEEMALEENVAAYTLGTQSEPLPSAGIAVPDLEPPVELGDPEALAHELQPDTSAAATLEHDDFMSQSPNETVVPAPAPDAEVALAQVDVPVGAATVDSAEPLAKAEVVDEVTGLSEGALAEATLHLEESTQSLPSGSDKPMEEPLEFGEAGAQVTLGEAAVEEPVFEVPGAASELTRVIQDANVTKEADEPTLDTTEAIIDTTAELVGESLIEPAELVHSEPALVSELPNGLDEPRAASETNMPLVTRALSVETPQVAVAEGAMEVIEASEVQVSVEVVATGSEPAAQRDAEVDEQTSKLNTMVQGETGEHVELVE